MLPPTRASRGGSGLSFSFRSCLLDCRRPGWGGGGPSQWGPHLLRPSALLSTPRPQDAEPGGGLGHVAPAALPTRRARERPGWDAGTRYLPRARSPVGILDFSPSRPSLRDHMLQTLTAERLRPSRPFSSSPEQHLAAPSGGLPGSGRETGSVRVENQKNSCHLLDARQSPRLPPLIPRSIPTGCL